ncbi:MULTISPECIES: FAD-dependent oxidoreductase [unclassified Brevibacterium]|uniref:FAD-dependent oxidoreductase n=1 Tax=unclassified Brevibacterium TaxID=2614124 RepID=UPI0010FA338D|nr:MULTISPECIES: FAD-dependent oxidoreductase [unclassified Brevibacterium]MCM1012615.1 FAD-dependent oxidoreductase [Brevibacterium sp. XM4083]
MTANVKTLTVDCVVVGGGPAGLICGLMLARAGVETLVIEKHSDFLRDFRGDTIHPATQDLLAELGLLEDFLVLPHADMAQVTLRWNSDQLVLADFSHLPTSRRVISFMPQWEFLDLIARAGVREDGFTLLRSTEVTGVVTEAGQVVGVRTRSGDGDGEVRARLVIGADGRDSTVRRAVGLVPRTLANAMDVLWFRLPKVAAETLPFAQAGAGFVIAIDRGDGFQVAHAIPAGTWDASPEALIALRRRIARIAPELRARMESVGLDDLRLLRVRLERLPQWSARGVLCIGDAAHAMSPAGGVGINLAIQDAVAAARELGPVLRERTPSTRELRAIQRRRAWPAAAIQWIQQRIQPMLLADDPHSRPPLPLRLIDRFPVLARVPGHIIGMGLRPEHIRRRRTLRRMR